MTLFDEIREALKRHNVTQADFAQMAGIREAYLSRIIHGEPDLRMSTVAKLRGALTRLENRELTHV